MSSNTELAIKFSNEIYATQQDVKTELRTSLIDGIWSGILEYRSNFTQVLTLPHITGVKYSVCLTPKISERVNNIERKIMKLSMAYSKLLRNEANEYFDIKNKSEVLSSIARAYGLSVEPTVLTTISKSTGILLPPNLMILEKYNRCLNEIQNNFLNDIDENTYGEFYTYLMGTDDLTEYYRSKETVKYAQYQVNPTYIGVPVNAIEKSIEQLVNFISYSDVNLFVKAVCTFYYTYYVKPFESYSEEISILMLKKVLANNGYEGVVAMLNFEQLLEDKASLEKVITECQRSLDLTYLVDYVMKKIEYMFDDLNDDIAVSQREAVKKDMFQADVVENHVKPQQVQQTIQPQPVVQPKVEEKPIVQEFVREPEPSIDPIFTEEPVKEPQHVEPVKENTFIRPVQNTITGAQNVNFNQNIAISDVPTGLSEEEAAKLEVHLLEMNPNLSRAQAYFYARHCTIGMNYTIAQFKKEVGCAYETARSSMDNLVLLGYYKKEPYKNKFIYMPVKK